MRAMRLLSFLAITLVSAHAFGATPQITEEAFRKNLGFGPTVQVKYRDLECKPVAFDGFASAMHAQGAHADVDRAADGTSITMTARLRGAIPCPSPYPPISSMPPFDLRDLNGKRVTSAGLRGKPTLVSFYFATCVPCILEVQPLNRFAAERPNMNFVAVTPDDAETARAFVQRFKFRWRVVPDARDFIDRVRVKQYPMVALFDAKGKLLGTRVGGARDELEAANVAPQLKLWMEGLLRNAK
jgi:cytochrome oxidase Cu insertion factor (SCO1/SenC/PrrC family)